MSFRAKLKRYLLILEKLRHEPSFAELSDHLREHGLDRSERTLQRDIEQLRVELGVEVAYDRTNNRYHIVEDGPYHDAVLQLLERAQLLELVDGDADHLRKLVRVVRFEGLGSLRGMHHLGPLLRAIRERREVKLKYRRFQNGEEQDHRLQPHLLKEYRGRWYVLGIGKGYDNPISLGLDRIEALEVTAKRFSEKRHQEVSDYYEPIIGVDATPGKAVRVVLRFTPLQGRYVKALPVHHSQEVLHDGEDHCDISLYVQPNYELRQWILSQGETVRVLEPKALVKEIGEVLKQAGEGYG
ncbi:MAG: WYL domain-containing protein [Flavobacteriales bacterium]|nr:WYL domain-containing protein [Flavobacteriales bacterium]